MGAWEFVRPLIETLLASRCPLRYVGRPRSASPSEGSAAWHAVNQRAIVDLAYDLRGELSPEVSTHERARAGETARLIG